MLEMEDKIRMLEMKNQDLSNEKDMFFQTLSTLDEYLA